MNLILEAAKYAEHCHLGQKRKWSGDPYIWHPGRVASRAAILPHADEFMVAAAWLHDTIEDCGVTEKDLLGFTPTVAALVVELTNTSKTAAGLSRAVRKAMDRQRLKTCSYAAKVIKLLDRIDNVRELASAPADFVALYLEESSALLKEALDGTDLLLERELADLIAKTTRFTKFIRDI